MEVSTEKNKIMTNGMNDVSADTSKYIKKLQEATRFKYLGVTLSKDGTSTAEIHSGSPQQ